MKFRILKVLILFLLATGHWPLATSCFGDDTQTPGLADRIVKEVQSRITASGRKMWEVKYTYSFYLNPPAGVDKVFQYLPSMAQQLQFRLQGKVGDRITVNIEYDDTQQKKQTISVIYTGESKEGGIQQVNFGDQYLYLPGTEFVAYNKQLFGLSVTGQYDKFKYYFIGSQTKGYSETKEYRGKSVSYVNDIWDNNFYQRKYYKLRHINQGREKIYVDDKYAPNNTLNTFYYSGTDPVMGDTVSGFFDPLVSGVDYIINYGTSAAESTTISFTKNIDKNYVILVYDIDGNNTFAIKDELNTDSRTTKYDLKNYYYLGNRNIVQNDINFLLEVWDPNGTHHPVSMWPNYGGAGNTYTVKINYDLGVINFVDATGKDVRPFRTDAYLTDNSVHTYTVHAEYKSTIQVFILRPNLVENSERVYLNGSLLRKDVDYSIDYASGFLSFYREDMITEDSVVKIDYEYMPFGGQYAETLMGVRGEFPLAPDFSIGSTYIFSGSPSPDDIPNMRSTPKTHQVVDVNGTMDPKSLLARLFPALEKVPFSTSFAYEGAYSWKDPNTFGKAMVDDMEGIKKSIDIPVGDTYSWRLSSAPTGESEGSRGLIGGNLFLPGGKDESHDPNATSPKSLVIDYSLPNSGGWVAMCYPVSKYAQDYSSYSSIEFWVKNPPLDPNLMFQVDLGILSEDADGRGGFPSDVYSGSSKLWSKGQPKTEDTVMADGRLNPGEDNGWTFTKADNSSVMIGLGNGRLDSEDLDGDGQLNLYNQKIHSLGGQFSGLLSSYVVGTSGSWTLFRIPLARQSSGDTDWTTVKHARLWLKNLSGAVKTGTLQIEGISIVGNRWSNASVGGTPGNNTFTVEARNTLDNGDTWGISGYKDPRKYIPPDSDDNKLNDNFEELHKNLEDDINNYLLANTTWPKEQSLALVYRFNEPCTGSVTQKFSTPVNLTEYKSIKFWMGVTAGSSGGTLFIRFGMDDNNYFESAFPVSASEEQIWQIKTIDMQNMAGFIQSATTTVTDPLDIMWNVNQITLGVYDTTTLGVTKVIWINEMHLDGSIVKEGYAFKGDLSVNIDNGMLSLGASYRKLVHTFETIGVASPAQDYEATSYSWGIPLSRFMPAAWSISLPYSGSWSQTRTELDPNTVRDVQRYKLGLRNQISQNHALSFSQPLLPTLSLGYNNSKIDSNFRGAEQKELGQNYSLRADYSYTFPKWLWYNLSLKPSYTYSSSYREISPGPSFIDVNYAQDHVTDAAASMNIQPIAQVSIDPAYSIRTINQQSSTNAPLGDARPVMRSQSLAVGTSTNLFKGVTPSLSFSEGIGENYFAYGTDTRKNVSASTSMDLNASISPKEWHEALKFFSLYNTFRISAAASYSSLDRSAEPGNINADLWSVFFNLRQAKSNISDSRTSSTNQKLYTLNTSLYLWDPLSTSASFSIGNDESQNLGSYSSTVNMGFGGSARLDVNQAFPDMKKNMESSYLMGNYSQRISEVVGSSKTTTITPNANWQIRWNPYLNQNFSFNWNMEMTENSAYKKKTSTISPSVTTAYSADIPLKIPVPFWKEVTLASRFDLNNNTSYQFYTSEQDINKEQTSKFDSTTGVTYNAAQNLQLTFSFGFSYYGNAMVPTSDYISLSVALRGVISF